MIVIICNQNGHVIAFDIFLVIIYFIIIQSSSKILTRRDNLFLLYLINLIKNSLLCDQNSHFFDPRYKGQLISKKIVRPRILQKNERMNWFLLVCVRFFEESSARKKRFEIIWPLHCYFFLHIERTIWCFNDMVIIFERFREYSKMVPQSSLLFSWLNFCKLAHTSTTEKSLENAALLLQ